MVPTDPRTLHVASEHVLLDDELRPASITAEVDASGVARVAEIVAGSAPDGTVLVQGPIVPAPLDLHFHGAGGHVVPPGGDADAIGHAVRAAAAGAGWTGPAGTPCAYEWVATLPIPQVPAPEPVEHVSACARAIAAASGSGCLGIRIEGLFLNPARAGVWPPESFRSPDAELLGRLHAAAADAGSRLLVVDIAPELPGAIELVERCVELGIVASLAHTDATWDEARLAIDAGARVATHTWNAMRPVAHRDPGVVAACLVDDRVTCELICDGVHLHPGILRLSTRASGRDGWIGVSDASPFAGCAPGSYDWAGTVVEHDGRALRDHLGHLAGSAALLDVAFEELRNCGVSTLDTAIAIGARPRRVLEPCRTIGLHVGDPIWILTAS